MLSKEKGKFYYTISQVEKKIVVNIYSEKMVFTKFMVLPTEIYTPIGQQNDRKHFGENGRHLWEVCAIRVVTLKHKFLATDHI